MKPTLLVLAAGMGSRYGGLKQMDPLGPGGETLLDYTIHDAVRAGFGRAVFVVRRDFEEAFRRGLGDRFAEKIAVDYAIQSLDSLPGGLRPPPGRVKPWGTGHAVLAAAEVVREPFAVVNADDFYGPAGFKALARSLAGPPSHPSASSAAMASASADQYFLVGYRLAATLSEHGTVSRGVCGLDAAGNLASVTESVKLEKRGAGAVDLASGRAFDGGETVSLNFFGFTPTIFGHLARAMEAFLRRGENLETGELYAPAVVDSLVREGLATVRVLPSPDPWFGVTYRPDKERVAQGLLELTRAGLYPERLRG